MINCRLNLNKPRGGYIALIALLIVAAVGLTIGLAVSLAGIDEIQVSYGKSQAALAKSLANTCLEEGLGRLHKDWADYSAVLPINGNSCIINAGVSGGLASLEATGIAGANYQKIQVQADNNLEIIAWQEE